jgi:peptidoglycan/LPS O-acetylase OafA/YrhL
LGNKNNFDCLRFISAIFVIFSHSFAISVNNYALDPLVNLTNKQISFGDLAVAIFFIISGFLVTQSFDRSQNLLYFLKARFLRIFPALITVIVLTIFIAGPLLSTLSTNEYFRNEQTYLYLNNILLYPIHYYLPGVFDNNIFKGVVNGSLWTLGYEVICYLLVGIIGSLNLLNKKSVLIMLLIVFCLSNMSDMPLNDFTYRLLYLGCYFIAGMFLYMYREHIKISNVYAVISVLVLIVSAKYGGLVKVAIPVFGSYIIYFLAFHSSIKFHNFGKRGDFSYGLYIYAFPIQQILVHHLGGKMDSTNNFLLSLVFTTFCAFISWHVIEKNALKLKQARFKWFVFKPKSVNVLVEK